MGIAELKRDKLLTGIGRLLRYSRGFDGGSVTDTDQTEDGNVTFGNAADRILDVRAHRAYRS